MIRSGLALVLSLAAFSALAQPQGAGASWYTILGDDGVALGYSSHEVITTASGREVIDTQDVAIVEEESAPIHVITRSVMRQDAAGRTLSIVSDTQTGTRRAKIKVTVHPGRLVIDHSRTGESRTINLDVSDTVRFDGGEGLLAGWDPAAVPRLEFEQFNVEAMLVERVVMEALPGGRNAQGRIAARRFRYDGDELRGASRVVVDRAGRTVEAVQPMFGSGLTVRLTDRATALKPHPPYKVLAGGMFASPNRISDAAALGHIRYHFTFKDELEFKLPETGEQRLTLSGGGVTLDICEGCGPGMASDPATLANALKPTVWMQSDNRELKSVVAPVANARRTTDAEKMEWLTEEARWYITEIDFTGHYSALETLTRRKGDCGEAAVLLAALGRAAGIPTKVASGIVYSRERYHGVSNVFMPHSWVLAYVDGKWRSYDSALPKFDSTHMAFSIGDGDPRSMAAARQLGGLLRWDSMLEVRTPPSR